MSVAKPKSSPARLAANRANARKSTGPRTEAGKARSRANALKHGLAGAGIALPGEDAAAIEAMFLQAQEEFAPTTLAGMRLVRDVAALWVRQDRARQYETRALAARARRASIDFDQARSDRANWLVDNIEANPRAYRRALLAMPEGVDRLVDGIAMLLDDLNGAAAVWTPAHHKRLDALFGYRVADLPVNRPTRFSKAVMGDYSAIGGAEIADVPAEERLAWAIEHLLDVIGAEVAHLAEHRAAIDPDRLAADRADAIALDSLDPGKDGALAQRYLSAAARDLSRALRDLHLVESRYGTDIDADADADLDIDADPVPEPITELDPIAAPEADPSPNVSSDPVICEHVTAPLASFGGTTPVAPSAAPVIARVASVPALGPIHTAEPAFFYPSIRQ